MAKKNKAAPKPPSSPFKPVLLGLFLIGVIVTSVMFMDKFFDVSSRAKHFTRGRAFTAEEVADTVRDLRFRQRNLDFTSPMAPGTVRDRNEYRRIS